MYYDNKYYFFDIVNNRLTSSLISTNPFSFKVLNNSLILSTIFDCSSFALIRSHELTFLTFKLFCLEKNKLYIY